MYIKIPKEISFHKAYNKLQFKDGNQSERPKSNKTLASSGLTKCTGIPHQEDLAAQEDKKTNRETAILDHTKIIRECREMKYPTSKMWHPTPKMVAFHKKNTSERITNCSRTLSKLRKLAMRDHLA
ncbi:unnamed protein product, partial [Brenthis ino]